MRGPRILARLQQPAAKCPWSMHRLPPDCMRVVFDASGHCHDLQRLARVVPQGFGALEVRRKWLSRATGLPVCWANAEKAERRRLRRTYGS